MAFMTRFGLLGFGHHAARRLVPAFARSTTCRLTGLWRRNLQQGQQDARALGIASFPTAEALCAAPEIDAIFITSPDACHLEDALLAFRHGKPVLCEKPLAMNAGQARQMAEAAEAAGCFFGVGQNFRFNQSVHLLRTHIAAGRIGTPQFAQAQYAYDATKAPRQWIADASLATGGPIADVGVHCLDTLRYLLADDFKSVATLASRDQLSGALEAMAALQLETRRGVLAAVTITARAPYRTYLEVVGTEGVLLAENGLTVDRPVDVILRRAGELLETQTVLNADAYTRMLEAFAHALGGHPESFSPTGRDGLVNQQLLDAAYRSWHSGLRETL